MTKEQKEERKKFLWSPEPLEFLMDVFPGDVITLKIPKHGKLYLKPFKVEICKETEQTQ